MHKSTLVLTLFICSSVFGKSSDISSLYGQRSFETDDTQQKDKNTDLRVGVEVSL